MALIDDIRLELGSAAPSDELLTLWIGDAQAAIQRRAERLGRVVDADDRDWAIRLAVVAHARNPAAETQYDVAIDDARVSRRRKESAGRVLIPDDVWSEIGLVDGAWNGWSGSIGYVRWCR